MIIHYIFKNFWWSPKDVVSGLVFMLGVAGEAHASGRAVILGYICETHKSARQVAVHRGWERPESMPTTCQILLGRPLPVRTATIVKVVEIIPLGDGRWIEIGRVRRDVGENGYSAGVVEKLNLF